ncbi:class I SAM-dependent methyltransferase [Bowdeniella massiliensis]|uniref:class I SAM-dependent methyltransferase n=1 Tax=Bowdeniella massiliensis TaxID=2932264 RepID=UPI002029459E|nr:class I SAM-dependent methyltransferase [Bowdeniella massiliensis]
MTHASEIAGLTSLLAHPEGLELLADLPPITSKSAILEVSSTLRKAGHDPDIIAAALTQQRLRAKAADKFGPFASSLLFTTEGLQQATRLEVAARHARRYRDAGCTRVADLGCGIGTESFALAGLGLKVVAVDADEAHAALALLNLKTFPEVTVLNARIEDLDLADLGIDGIFADPARRSDAGRSFDPETWSPPLSSIMALRAVVANVGVKVAPGIAYENLPSDSHVQWTSVDGSLVEAAIWCGDLAPEGPGRSAVVLSRGGQATTYAAPVSSARAPATIVDHRALEGFVHEVDPAILRAGALATIAEQLSAGLISPDISYLTSSAPADLAGVTSFRVIETLPAKAKVLAAELRQRDIGSVEILKRGIDIVPDDFRRRLKLRGSHAATLMMTRVAGRHAAVLVERI